MPVKKLLVVLLCLALAVCFFLLPLSSCRSSSIEKLPLEFHGNLPETISFKSFSYLESSQNIAQLSFIKIDGNNALTLVLFDPSKGAAGRLGSFSPTNLFEKNTPPTEASHCVENAVLAVYTAGKDDNTETPGASSKPHELQAWSAMPSHVQLEGADQLVAQGGASALAGFLCEQSDGSISFETTTRSYLLSEVPPPISKYLLDMPDENAQLSMEKFLIIYGKFQEENEKFEVTSYSTFNS